MQTISTANEIIEYTSNLRKQGVQIGFVPTMGALHAGHLSLISASKAENELTICSIFVNPTQFNAQNDFDKYPRQLDHDIGLLEAAGCDVLFAPSVSEVYPKEDKEVYKLGEISEILEGTKRPGHFNGMASVVKRLFELNQPHKAYFGLKDYQQCLVVKALVKNYGLPINIVCCDILREDSGLAMSSRNQLLSKTGKAIATNIFKCLNLLRIERNHLRAEGLCKKGREYLESVSDLKLEYLEIVDSETLLPAKEGSKKVALIAAWVEGVRLIDNMILD